MKRTLKSALVICTIAMGTLSLTSCYDPTAEEIFTYNGGGGDDDGGGGQVEPPDTLANFEEIYLHDRTQEQ